MSANPKHPRRAAEPLLRMPDGKPAQLSILLPPGAEKLGILGTGNSLNVLIAPAGQYVDYSKAQSLGLFGLN